MDHVTVKILTVVACWALLAASWGVFYKMRPKRWLRDTFTMHRWNANPFQMYMTFLLLQVSINQIVIGVPENSANAALDHEAQIALAACNLIGATISALALHMRDVQFALWLELAGYAALAGSLGIYVYLVFAMFPLPNTSFGLALTEAFVFASLHRSIWICWYKRARHRGRLAEASMLLRQLEGGGT